MKLPCNVIEDMLPMYYDGVCSEESVALVEDHLKACPQCSRVLSDLHSGIGVCETRMDDLKPLDEIKRKWNKSKRVYIVRGISITLVVLLLLVTAMTSIWYFSYARYYYQLTRNMGRISGEEATMTAADYALEKDGYRFDVNVPAALSNSGFVRVADQDGMVLFLYPEIGGKYTFWCYITDSSNRAYSVYLKSDMTADFENHPFPVRSEKEKEHIQQVLIEKKDDLAAMLNAIYVLWGIDLLDYVP